ncbi:hypothetical protein A1QC_04070 [Vibrio rumoiensis 1S-45]|uniref:DUF4124 domain-containing protein n=2 Tax=Vibrio rumoiensis TaxID=76258 RepID=A0A1E5E646_9VIBR|nr:hypothetical protein A1QC_04070 [Vibrio rumoiensis 1S-45]
MPIHFAAANEIYKWTDSKGILHFSDTPPPEQVKNEERLKLPDIKAPAPAPQYGSSSTIDKPIDTPDTTLSAAMTALPAIPENMEPTETKKISLNITNLTENQTIRSNRGIIAVQVALNRKLGIGEHLQLMLDTQPYGAPQTTLLWELENINRGAHTFSVNVVESGKVIASSNPITVHLHRTTVK